TIIQLQLFFRGLEMRGLLSREKKKSLFGVGRIRLSRHPARRAGQPDGDNDYQAYNKKAVIGPPFFIATKLRLTMSNNDT
ncbi:hypothetical protein ACQWKR_24230, partial [Salmonella enterica subsp. enterica serovar Infantis]